MTIRHRLLAASLYLILPVTATALPVRVVFDGVVTDVTDASGEPAGDLAVGTPFSVTAIYDDQTPSAPPTSVENGVSSRNFLPSPPNSFSARIGAWSIEAGPFGPDAPLGGNGFELSLFDRSGSQGGFDDVASWSTHVATVSGPGVPVFESGSLRTHLLGVAGTLSSLALADIPLDLAHWEQAELVLDLLIDPEQEQELFVTGAVTRLSVHPIPEPASAALLALGLLALAAPRRAGRWSASR